MPAILTHYTFALKAIPEELVPFTQAVNLGSQGPDTFMAFGTVPWRKRKEVEKVRGWGHAMHSLPVEKVYLPMMDYARKAKEKDLLYAYIEGLLMHFCLDRLMHAYIFYRSGVDQDGKLSGYYGWSHGAFEAILDKVLAKREGTYGRLDRCILTPEAQVKEISKMWKACSPTPLHEDDFYLSYLDFVGAERLLYTPHGFKRPLFRLLGKYSTPNAQSHPLRMKRFEKMDVMNDARMTWHNPATDEPHDDSVMGLFNQALKDFASVHALVSAHREGEDIADAFAVWTKGLDHEGGPVGKKKTHYDLCWKVLGKKKYLPR